MLGYTHQSGQPQFGCSVELKLTVSLNMSYHQRGTVPWSEDHEVTYFLHQNCPMKRLPMGHMRLHTEVSEYSLNSTLIQGSHFRVQKCASSTQVKPIPKHVNTSSRAQGAEPSTQSKSSKQELVRKVRMNYESVHQVSLGNVIISQRKRKLTT